MKEPYYDNSSTLTYSPLSAKALKLSPTTDFPIIESHVLATPTFPRRRLSIEPYYKSSSRRNTTTSSTSSLYALLSDVFDYNYLNKNDDFENAIESDSDYEDYIDHSDGDSDEQAHLSDPEFDSELEDYNVHLIIFKANSRTAFPPATSLSTVDDNFDKSSRYPVFLDALNIKDQPKFPAPPCLSMDSPDILGLRVEEDLRQYSERCDDVVGCPKIAVHVAPKGNFLLISDAFDRTVHRLSASDAFDIENHLHFL